jgi:predicted DNA-binding protein (MmcQ/YjbR family)
MTHGRQLEDAAGQRLLTALREVCMRLPETTEVVDGFGHTTFKVRNRSFVIAGDGDDGLGSIALKSDPVTQSHLIRRGPYFRTRYIGQHGWISLMDPLRHDWSEVQELIVDAWRLAAPKRLAATLER